MVLKALWFGWDGYSQEALDEVLGYPERLEIGSKGLDKRHVLWYTVLR